MGASAATGPGVGVTAGLSVLDAADAATVAMRQARAAQLDRVHEAVTSGRWQIHGFRSPQSWLVVASGESPGACTLTLQLADRIQHMPIVRDRFASGVLAESALRLLADAWHPDLAAVFGRDEHLLVRWATTLAHRDFKLVLSTWLLHADPDRAERTAADQFDSRKLHVSELMDGMGRLDGLLDPEGTKLVREAIKLLSRPTDGDTRTAEQRRADAIVTMARMTITAHADAAPATRGRKRNRPTLLATISWDDLVGGTTGGTLDTSSGPVTLTVDAVRRLACDAGVHRLITGPGSTIIDYGRKARTVSDAQLDLLTARDHGCRVPGCPVGAEGCDAHHAVPWSDGGPTDVDNTILVCWYHHHWLHEQHWRIEPLGAGHFLLIDPFGNEHELRAPTLGPTLPESMVPGRPAA